MPDNVNPPNVWQPLLPVFLDWNPFWDEVNLAQGPDVRPNSEFGVGDTFAWKWGTRAYSGDVGGHPPYGYRHLYKFVMTEASNYTVPLSAEAQQKICRAVISMTTARHVAYSGLDSLLRWDDYEWGGRIRGHVPVANRLKPYEPGWTPGSNYWYYYYQNPVPTTDSTGQPDPSFPPYWPGLLWNDVDRGWVKWEVGAGLPWIQFTGWDSAHYWSFLWDLLKVTGGVTVPFLPSSPGSETIDITLVARARLRVEMMMIMGMMNDPWYGNLPDWDTDPIGHLGNCSDRPAARFLQTAWQAWKNGMFDDAYYQQWTAQTTHTMSSITIQFIDWWLNFWEKNPGASFTTKGGAPLPYLQPHNLVQSGAACYDWANALDPVIHAARITRLRNFCKRAGKWVAELYQTSGGPYQHTIPSGAFFSATPMAGIDGAPLPSLAASIISGDVTHFNEPWHYTGWCYRGLRCAAALGVTEAADVAALIKIDYEHVPFWWAFMVDENWNYSIPYLATLFNETEGN